MSFHSPARRLRAAETPILLADPDADTRDILERVLEQAGYAVMAVADGESAWTLAHGILPRLVITELYLRVRGRRCLVRPLKAALGRRGTRVLVYSAHAFRRDRAWAQTSGGDAFLSKPAPPSEVLRLVRELLASPGRGVAGPGRPGGRIA
jgi:twitching motility two-component system response regulator PilH